MLQHLWGTKLRPGGMVIMDDNVSGKPYDEDEEFVERFLARTALFEDFLLDEHVLDKVKGLGYEGVLFALRGRDAYASVGGVVGCGRTPSAALADALSKIYVPEVQS